MRLSLRFILPLILALGIVAYGTGHLIDSFTLRWFVRDLDVRSSLIVNAIRDPLEERLIAGRRGKVGEYFSRITQDERLFGLGYCASPESQVLANGRLPKEFSCASLERWEKPDTHLQPSEQGPLHVSVKPMPTELHPEGKLVLVHDMSFVTRRSEETTRYVFYFFLGLAALVSLITVVIAQLSWRGWVSGMRALLRGEGLLRQPVIGGALPAPPEFRPIARELQRLIQDLENETRARDDVRIKWSPDALRTILHGELSGEDVIVVSNREPYIHQRKEDRIEVQRPASGLVTALEPIMRACSGTWVAHGSGSADRDVVDKFDRVAVPPENPAYQIRRVWLTAEEEAGYYYGFANEGMWPLCHIAHVRPTFRSGDWTQYKAVNRKFAEAVIAESKTRNPIVLIQDYHFALLPRMIREALPDATIITFWHIPWPNPESFAICPWRKEILDGLLGSSILGFHTQFHCNNFVDTVDRTLEARVDRESFTVSLRDRLTAVRRYPISIDWPPAPEMVAKPVVNCRVDLRAQNGLPDGIKMGIGVDRMDYTKGILERFLSIQRLLELHPEWVGRFTFIQIAAPTRTGIEEYQHHEDQIRNVARQINERFGKNGIEPILLKVEHHEPRQVYEYFRAADVCVVSSLHDGMNLVAKEFVAARDDELGVLILSRFTGAARELPESLIVNPYDFDQCAAAMHTALLMPETEQRDRMRLMRGLVAEFNVYRWAGRMLLDAAAMRRREGLLNRLSDNNR